MTRDLGVSSSVDDSAPAPVGQAERGIGGPFEPVATTLRYPLPSRSIDPDTTKRWIRRIRPVVSAHRWLFLVFVLSGCVMVATQALIPRWLGYALDEALVRAERPLAPYVWMLLGLTAAGTVSGITHRYFIFKAAYAIEFDLRTLIYQHLTRLSFSFYDRAASGELISRANSDIRAIQLFLAFGPAIAVRFLLFPLALFFMIRIDVVLMLLAITVLPVVYGVGMRLRNYMFPISWMVQARMADLAGIVDENINGVRIIRSFAAEKLQIRALARAAQRLEWAAVLRIRVRARLAPIIENITRLGEALILLYGGLLVIRGRMGPGDILVFMGYLVMLQAPFRSLGFLVMMSQRAAASAQRIFEVLDEVPAIRDRPGATDLVDCRGDVEFSNVDFRFADGPQVLRGLNVRIEAGETVAVVGRTGSGKTTVAELIPRFYDVDGGAILIDGHDVRDVTLASLRAHIGVCFEEPFLFSVSIRDNIAYGRPDATDEEVIAAAKAAGAHDFIMQLAHGYATVVGERGYTLSGGQRQRIAIARSVLENPRILILDDATSSIDVKVEVEIHDALRRLFAGRTTVIIAHRLSTIGLAQRVVLLDAGRVVASGTHDQLMASEPRYAQMLARMDDGGSGDPQYSDGLRTVPADDVALTMPGHDDSDLELP